MKLFFLVLYLTSGEIKTGPFLNDPTQAINQANAELAKNPKQLTAVEVFDINGKCIYSIGE
jgi:hypothetical protein